MALIFDIIAGADASDNLTISGLGRTPDSGYMSMVSTKDDLKGMKLGIPWHPYWATAGVGPCELPAVLEGKLIVARTSILQDNEIYLKVALETSNLLVHISTILQSVLSPTKTSKRRAG